MTREQQLLSLGFERNDHQRCYGLFKFNVSWHVDFWRIEELNNNEWYTYIECLKYDIRQAEIDLKSNFEYELGFSAHKKEIEKLLRDLKNKYKSWYQQETQCKMGRGNPNFKRETELLAKIELIEEIQKKLK